MEVKDLSVFSRKTGYSILNHLSFRIRRNTAFAIVGPTGAGKSTLLRSLMGLNDSSLATQGQILYQNINWASQSQQNWNKIRGSKITLAFQELEQSFNPIQKIGRQLAEPLKIHRSQKDHYQTVTGMLHRLGFNKPELIYEMYPGELSGGMRQRAMIALALVNEPEIVLLDEATSALDLANRKRLTEVLWEEKQRRGLSVLAVSHDLDWVREFSDEILVLEGGQIIEKIETKNLASSYQNSSSQIFKTKQIEKRIINSPCVVSKLKLKKLNKSFRDRKVIQDFDLEIFKGETVGLVGPSGIGKTTLARCVLGSEQFESGEIYWEGRSFPKSKELAFHKKIQMIYQDPYGCLNPKKTVKQILDFPLKLHFKRLNKTQRLNRIESLLATVALGREKLESYPGQLSGGEQQRVGIARALAVEPELIICDEAVSQLDVFVQRQILELLRELQERLGVSYLFISHDEAVVDAFSHRVVRMKEILEERSLGHFPTDSSPSK